MKKATLIIAISLLSFYSCKQDEFLEKEPFDRIISKNVVQNFPTFDAAARGVYDIFQDVNYYNGAALLMTDLMSDDVRNNAFVTYLDVDAYQVNSNDANVRRLWDRIPKVIAQSSIVIRQAEAFNFGADRDRANRIIGELYVARALAYFDMQRFFAQPYNFTNDASHPGVPLIDEKLVGIEILSPSRSTTKKVYDKIVADLLKAIPMLSATPTSAYYFNQNSAKALLAKVYLYMGNWSEANRLATEVINTGAYTLVTNANYVASWTLASTSESIFSVANTLTDNAGNSSMTNFYKSSRHLATNDLFNFMDANDVRKRLITVGTMRITKFTAVSNDNNLPVLRLSEMFLIQAEALAEMGGAENETLALAALNRIRLRANPTAGNFTGLGVSLKNEIQNERRKELMFEGNRLFDLTRKKRSFTKFSTTSATPIAITYPSNFTIFPIPQTEIDANDNISASDQNPGY
jgi:tetratricopeptide (TPR) repeat protein